MKYAKRESLEHQSTHLEEAQIDLFSWSGDVSSLIREMKMRVGCEFDRELATFLGKGHTAIAQWRRRGAVPEAALLRLEARLRVL